MIALAKSFEPPKKLVPIDLFDVDGYLESPPEKLSVAQRNLVRNIVAIGGPDNFVAAVYSLIKSTLAEFVRINSLHGKVSVKFYKDQFCCGEVFDESKLVGLLTLWLSTEGDISARISVVE